MVKINLRKLLAMHAAGEVLYYKPDSRDLFADDVPSSLLDANAEYVKAKAKLDAEIEAARKLI